MMKTLIEQLSNLYGPPGYEQAVRDALRELATPHVSRVGTDALGNLHAVKEGAPDGQRIMLAAHMDEIGLMVSFIDQNGFARVTRIGGVFPQTVVGSRVRFTNGAVAVLNAEKWPYADDVKRDMKKVYLDFGVRDKADVPVQIGDVCGFAGQFTDLGETVIGKSLDNRVGCAVLVELLRRVENSSPHEIHAVFTVQEEVGSRGAFASSFTVNPDISLAIDVTDCGDTPGHDRHLAVKLGDGPAIKIMDSGSLSHPSLVQSLAETAEQADIPYQREILTFGATDARAMQTVRGGSLSGALSIPCRHIHTTAEMVNINDVTQAVDLLVAWLKR